MSRLLSEVIIRPPSSYRFRRPMTAAEAIWRIAKESYGASYEDAAERGER